MFTKRVILLARFCYFGRVLDHDSGGPNRSTIEPPIVTVWYSSGFRINNRASNWNLLVLLSNISLLFQSRTKPPIGTCVYSSRVEHYFSDQRSSIQPSTFEYLLSHCSLLFRSNIKPPIVFFSTPLAWITTFLVNNWTSNYNFLVLLSHRSLLLCSTMEPPNVTFWYSSRTDHHFSG